MNKLHYKGDHRKFQPNRLVGPDQYGAWYLPVSAHYFDGVTTIFYKPVPPDKLPPQCHEMSKQVVQQQQRLRKVGERQWPNVSASSASQRSPSSSLDYQVSRRSGTRKTKGESSGTRQKRSQQGLLPHFKRPGSR